MREEGAISEEDMYQVKRALKSMVTARGKGPLKDKSSLICFFNVWINLDSDWNHDQRAIQVEGILDIVLVRQIDYNFLLLIDQSSGHGRMRKGTLNVNFMSVKFITN